MWRLRLLRRLLLCNTPKSRTTPTTILKAQRKCRSYAAVIAACVSHKYVRSCWSVRLLYSKFHIAVLERVVWSRRPPSLCNYNVSLWSTNNIEYVFCTNVQLQNSAVVIGAVTTACNASSSMECGEVVWNVDDEADDAHDYDVVCCIRFALLNWSVSLYILHVLQNTAERFNSKQWSSVALS